MDERLPLHGCRIVTSSKHLLWHYFGRLSWECFQVGHVPVPTVVKLIITCLFLGIIHSFFTGWHVKIINVTSQNKSCGTLIAVWQASLTQAHSFYYLKNIHNVTAIFPTVQMFCLLILFALNIKDPDCDKKKQFMIWIRNQLMRRKWIQ